VHDGCPTLQKSVPLPVWQIRAAGFRDARTIVAVGSDDTLRVLDASSGAQLKAWRLRYKGFTNDPVTSAAISPDGEFAVIGLDNGSLVLANTHTGDTRSLIAAQPELSNLAATSISAVAWSRNGQDIALSEGNGAVIVLGRDGQTVMNVPGLGAESLQFMLGGSTLMGVDATGTAHVWDLGTGSILSNFPVEHFAPPHNRFTFPDLGGGTSLTPVGGSKLLVTDPGAYPAIFDLGIANLLSHACRTAGRQLSQAEIQQLAAPAPRDVWSCK
jgi:WD40 repeat protein